MESGRDGEGQIVERLNCHNVETGGEEATRAEIRQKKRGTEKQVMVKILLADDDEVLRGAMAKALQRLGYEIRTAENGRQALLVLREWLPDLIIIDLIMPEQEGLETIQMIRAKDKTVKIIAISGGGVSNPNDYLKIALHLGADAILAKPFELEKLQAVITQVLPGNVAPPTSALT
jgi:CheY-like chemotaxis protein